MRKGLVGLRGRSFACWAAGHKLVKGAWSGGVLVFRRSDGARRANGC